MPWLRAVCCALGVAALAFSAEAQVYRCGNTYSNVPCTGAKEVDTSPTLSWGQAKGGTETLYLCQAYGGGQFWTRQHCRQRDALVERMESVPSGMPFEQQVELGRQRLAQSRPETEAPSPTSRGQPTLAAARAGRCSYLMTACANSMPWRAPAGMPVTWTGSPTSGKRHATSNSGCAADTGPAA